MGGNPGIEVTHDVDTLKAKLHELMPGEDIKVYSAQSRLILSGQVANAAPEHQCGAYHKPFPGAGPGRTEIADPFQEWE